MSEAPAEAHTPGSRLRFERERLGISLQQAADDMKLDTWALEALEGDDYERIGPAVYAKGHLKKYASLLGVPGTEILGAYEHLKSRSSEPAVGAQRGLIARALLTPLPWPKIAGGVAFAFVAALIWWKPWQRTPSKPATTASLVPSTAQGSAPAEAPPPPPPPPRSEAPPPPQPKSDAPPGGALGFGPGAGALPLPVSPAAAGETAAQAFGVAGASSSASGAGSFTAALGSAPRAGTAGGTAAHPMRTALATPATYAPTAAFGRARLRMAFSADSWVDVRDAAGRRLYTGRGRANTVRSVGGSAPLRVYIGFASGVQLQVNEHAVAIGPQFLNGDIARFQAGADGVLRRDPASGTLPGGAAAPGAGAGTPGVATPGVATPGVATPGRYSRNDQTGG
jgi:cytoskeleton protein RodZ